MEEEEEEERLDMKFLPLTFIPNIIIEEIMKESICTIPYQIHNNAIILIADVCGFTSLTESYCQKGTCGIEELAKILNGYMSTLAARDAFLVYWPDTERSTEYAFNCAVALQTHDCLQTKNLDGTLKVKIGIGKGKVVNWILGSPDDFLLFVMAGHAIAEAHHAEEMCQSGDIIISQEVFKALKKIRVDTFKTTELSDGFVKISDYEGASIREPDPKRFDKIEGITDEHVQMTKIFLIPSLRDLRTGAELSYISELTMVTILFISLMGIDAEEPETLDQTFDIVLACAKSQGGVLNKMLLFDKGCTYLVVFGLPGQKHADDAARGLLCANDIIKKHREIDLNASIGIATGTCYCGIVGHILRQEYTVVGHRVNLAARIMVKYRNEPIVLDSTTYHLSRESLGDDCFYQLPCRKMKGIESAGYIYAFRIRTKSIVEAESSVQFAEPVSEAKGEDDKGKLLSCLKTLFQGEERSKILDAGLKPVIVVQGISNSGKNYYMYYGVCEAEKIGYKVCCCCTLETYRQEPFMTIGLLIQRMLDMSPQESVQERQQKILDALPGGFDPQLYLLNHLFHVQFPPPEMVNIDETYIRNEATRLLKIIFKEFGQGTTVLIAIDEAESMDDDSWLLIRQLTEEGTFVIMLSISEDFKRPSISACMVLLKMYTCIRIKDSVEDYFASIVCWFLGVKAVEKELYR
ncbi:adenylate cyclase type 10 [Trichonephila clavata]|uniref:Adenylate cyclase type 10 n=1 Tax=Trichonephila clavata TaxID=2740835 RepID=A0A8X6HVV8_TRICU|nr:adenylate cyclase type 10 [Trichonephila clavata]